MRADGPSGIDLIAATTSFLLPVAYLPLVEAPFWSPKAAVLLPAAAVGLTRLAALHRTRLRDATRAGVAFGLVASVSAALSDDVDQAVFGLYNFGTGALFVWALVGMWALGASVTEAGRQRVVAGLVGGIALSAAVGILQVVVDLGIPSLGSPIDDRATGLAGNPVHLAALAVGVLGLAALQRGTSRRWLAAVAVSALVIQLTGSRFAVLMVAIVVAATLLTAGRRRAAAVLVCAGLGFAVGYGVAWSTDDTSSGTERVLALSSSGGGITARSETWLSARHAFVERPLVGVGPGRFHAGVTQHRTLALARSEGPDRLFVDAHNIVVEHVVTTGLLGVASFLAFLGTAVAAARRDRALMAFALGIGCLHLVQPQSFGTTPLIFLALGVATSGMHHAPRVSGPQRASAATAGLLGLGLGAVLLVGDANLHRARTDFSDASSRAAVRLLRPFPEPAVVRARLFLFESLGERGGTALDEALRWRRTAIDRLPLIPAVWNQLAEEELADGRLDSALAHFSRAVALDPWSVRGLNGLVATNLELGDEAAARRAADRSLLVVARQPRLVALLEQP